MFNSLFASSQMSLQVKSSIDELITRWTTIGFKDRIDIGDIANVAFIT